MSDNPENAVLRSEFDTSMAGLYASLVAGCLMLVYAIWYVTSLEGIDDNSFLILGLITGLTAISVIGMHEWFRHQNGADRPENPIEEYAGAGAVSAVWLTRVAVFYGGPLEKDWIDVGFQEGEVWMPVWLAALQAVCMLLVMEVSTRSIRRHSLGTLPRTVVILAPLSLAFSGIPIWLDYSRGELEIFVTFSLILLTCSAILYSLRLDRAVLYQVSSGMAVFLPILPMGMVVVLGVGFRIVGPAGPVRTAAPGAESERGDGALGTADNGWGKDRAQPVARDERFCFGTQLRGEVDKVFDGRALAVVSGWFRREWLGGRVPFSGHIPLRYRPFFNGPDRFAGLAVKHVEERLLAWLCDGFDFSTVDDDVDQDGRTRHIEAPDGVMYELKMPASVTGMKITGYKALAE